MPSLPDWTLGRGRAGSAAASIFINGTERPHWSGRGKCRKQSSSDGPSKKTKKSQTWTHSWVCLSGMVDDQVPDATERVSLKIAGLGESRFAVDVSATPQEL